MVAPANLIIALNPKHQAVNIVLDHIPENAASASSSQDSSLNSAFASQESHEFRAPIQPTYNQQFGMYTSPPSSQSVPAIQDEHDKLLNGTSGLTNTNSASIPPQDISLSNNSLASRNGVYKVDTTLGQKRTANGQVKSPGSGQSTSPIEPVVRGHSRHTSSTSQISDVSRNRYPYKISSLTCAALRSVENTPLICGRKSTEGMGNQNTRRARDYSIPALVASIGYFDATTLRFSAS